MRALRDAPSAFASTFEEESERPDTWWICSIGDLAWFVFEHSDEVVGLAGGLAAGTGGECPELISMWVDRRYRGTRAAEALLSAVLEWAASKGSRQLSAWVSHGNERARRFYERAGFVSTGLREPLPNRPEIVAEELRVIV